MEMELRKVPVLSGKRILILGAKHGIKSVSHVVSAIKAGAEMVFLALPPQYKIEIKRILRSHLKGKDYRERVVLLVPYPGLGTRDCRANDLVQHLMTLPRFVACKIDACVSFEETSIILAAEVCSILGLPGCDPNGVRATVNKSIFRQRMKEDSTKFTSQQALFATLPNFVAGLGPPQLYNFPVIIKPAEGIGSVGVFLVQSMEDLKNKLHQFECSHLTKSNNYSEWLIEEYLEGIEVGVEIIMSDGQCKFASVMECSKTPPPVFQGTGRFFPSSLGHNRDLEIVQHCITAVKLLNLNNSVIDIDCKYVFGRGPVIVEINCRMGGHSVSLMHDQIFGLDLVLEHFRCGCGINDPVLVPFHSPSYPMASPSERKTWYTRLVLSQKAGTLIGLTNSNDSFETTVRSILPDSFRHILKAVKMSRDAPFSVDVSGEDRPSILAMVVAEGRDFFEADQNAEALLHPISTFVNNHIIPQKLIHLPSLQTIAFMSRLFVPQKKSIKYYNNSNHFIAVETGTEAF